MDAQSASEQGMSAYSVYALDKSRREFASIWWKGSLSTTRETASEGGRERALGEALSVTMLLLDAEVLLWALEWVE